RCVRYGIRCSWREYCAVTRHRNLCGDFHDQQPSADLRWHEGIAGTAAHYPRPGRREYAQACSWRCEDACIYTEHGDATCVRANAESHTGAGSAREHASSAKVSRVSIEPTWWNW